MKRIVLILLIGLAGCGAPKQAKDIVRNKHVVTYIMSKKLQDDNKNNDPTYEQLKDFMILTAKDWESMDRLLNNWKPDVMKTIELGK